MGVVCECVCICVLVCVLLSEKRMTVGWGIDRGREAGGEHRETKQNERVVENEIKLKQFEIKWNTAVTLITAPPTLVTILNNASDFQCT